MEAGLALTLVLAIPGVAAAAEMSKDILAVQIRKQGHLCGTALSATRDTQASKPDNEVWLLTCYTAAYRVQLVPNMAATVERMPDNKQTQQN
jgi:hypothetical protein